MVFLLLVSVLFSKTPYLHIGVLDQNGVRSGVSYTIDSIWLHYDIRGQMQCFVIYIYICYGDNKFCFYGNDQGRVPKFA